MPNKEKDEWLRVIGVVVESPEDVTEAVASPFEGKPGQPRENGTVLADAPTGGPNDKTTTSTQVKKLVDKCPAIKKGSLTYEKPRVTELPKGGGWIVELPDKQEGPFKTEKEANDAAKKMAKEAQDDLGDLAKKDDECVHKGADWIYQDGTYWVSVPSGASGTLPLVVLFGGTNGKLAVCKQTPQSYFDKAILVFAEMSGSFSGAEGVLKKVLNPGLTHSVVTICGYSGGGPAALAASSSANHALGLIDPTLHANDKFNAKTILSIYESGAWDGSDRDTPVDPKDPKKHTGTVEEARHAALQKVLDAGGYAETTCVQHYSYPQGLSENVQVGPFALTATASWFRCPSRQFEPKRVEFRMLRARTKCRTRAQATVRV